MAGRVTVVSTVSRAVLRSATAMPVSGLTHVCVCACVRAVCERRWRTGRGKRRRAARDAVA